jgi:hypothetical protein
MYLVTFIELFITYHVLFKSVSVLSVVEAIKRMHAVSTNRNVQRSALVTPVP